MIRKRRYRFSGKIMLDRTASARRRFS